MVFKLRIKKTNSLTAIQSEKFIKDSKIRKKEEKAKKHPLKNESFYRKKTKSKKNKTKLTSIEEDMGEEID